MYRAAAFLALAVLAVSSFTSASASTDSAKAQQLAQKLVSNVLQPKPNDVVLIAGGPSNLAAMEDFATNLRKAGAYAIIVYNSNRMTRMYYDNVPARYDSQYPRDVMGLVRIVNAVVSFDEPVVPSTTAGVDPHRMMVQNKTGAVVTDYINKHNIPFIDVGNGMVPSAATAQQFGISQAQLSDMFWNALTADYGQLHANAAAMANMLHGAHMIHVTAPNGTDVTFSATGSRMFLNDGTISAADRQAGGPKLTKYLPTGDVYFSPTPGSAKGTIVFGDFYYNNTRISHMQMRLANGRLASWTASSGMPMVMRFYKDGGTGRDLFTWADFGVNPGMQFVKGSSMYVSQIAGMVTLGIGGNYGFGGTDRSPFGLAGYIPNATVTVDGKTVATNGKLVQELTQH